MPVTDRSYLCTSGALLIEAMPVYVAAEDSRFGSSSIRLPPVLANPPRRRFCSDCEMDPTGRGCMRSPRLRRSRPRARRRCQGRYCVGACGRGGNGDDGGGPPPQQSPSRACGGGL
jgi:hypothetical protein